MSRGGPRLSQQEAEKGRREALAAVARMGTLPPRSGQLAGGDGLPREGEAYRKTLTRTRDTFVWLTREGVVEVQGDGPRRLIRPGAKWTGWG